MKKLSILILLFLATSSALFGAFLMPNEAFKPSVTINDQQQVVAKVTLGKDIYLYEKFLKVEIENPPYIHIVKTEKPKSTLHHDEMVFLSSPTYLLTLQSDEDKGVQEVQVKLSYQGCSEEGLCYEPLSKTFTLQIDTSKIFTPSNPPFSLQPIDESQQDSKIEQTPIQTQNIQSKQDQIADTIKNSSFLVIIATFFVFGLLLSLTPCVFPMIPIISGVIISQGEGLTTKKAFALSLTYVLAMAVAYTIAGVLAGVFGANLQATLQNPWVVISFSLIFVALALSMFGFYELKLPDALVSKVSQNSNKGGFVGVAIMGFLSALIVGPCVAAPLAGALVYIGQTGDAFLGGMALFSMSLGMGLPLILVGVSAGKFMPKPGGWMTMVNATFGVLMLIVAIWMLEKIAPLELTAPLYAVVGLGFALYLNPFKESHIFKRTVAFVLFIYSLALLLGSLTGKPNLLHPLKFLTTTTQATVQPQELQFQTVTSLEQLNKILEQNRGKKIMMDFSAAWCVACKEFDEITFSDPKVQKALGDFVLIRADITANDKDAKKLSEKFQVFGPPVIIFFDENLNEIKSKTIVGFMEPQPFLDHLQTVYKE